MKAWSVESAVQVVARAGLSLGRFVSVALYEASFGLWSFATLAGNDADRQ